MPLGVQCTTFLAELANAKAENPDWAPAVFLTSTCASPLILGLAGEAADGMFTSASMGLYDVLDPAHRGDRTGRRVPRRRWRRRGSATS